MIEDGTTGTISCSVKQSTIPDSFGWFDAATNEKMSEEIIGGFQTITTYSFQLIVLRENMTNTE